MDSIFASESVLPRSSGRVASMPLLLLVNLAAIVVIAVADYMLPPGAAVGVLLSIPIILSCLSGSERQVWITTAVAVTAAALAALFDPAPTSSALVWIPNQVLVFLFLPASCVLALMLQRRRLEAERARDAALSASGTNEVLRSLLAHDLRAPLTLTSQVVGYLEETLDRGEQIDRKIISELGAKLDRSLRAIDLVLSVACPEMSAQGNSPRYAPEPAPVRNQIEEEVASFAREARLHRKKLVTELDALDERQYQTDGRVLRQALAILIDNAIRYAAPGRVRITGRADSSELVVRVEDSGPDLAAQRSTAPKPHGGSGLGLQLCRILLVRAGGRLELERQDKNSTCFAIRVPIRPAAESGAS